MEKAIEAGAEDVQTVPGEEGYHEIVCLQDDFSAVRDALEKSLGAPGSARLVWRPKTTTSIDGDTAQTLFKLIEMLEDSDDVQHVYANFEVSDDTLARLAG
jgi:transcriptional/translational regulatory protein YebC/TACO1